MSFSVSCRVVWSCPSRNRTQTPDKTPTGGFSAVTWLYTRTKRPDTGHTEPGYGPRSLRLCQRSAGGQDDRVVGDGSFLLSALPGGVPEHCETGPTPVTGDYSATGTRSYRV